MAKSELHIAYKRVSTIEQSLDRQLAECSIPFSFVYEEKASGKDATRPELQRLLRDENLGKLHMVTLHIHSLDRLARNLSDLLSIVEILKAKGWTVRFHKENLTFSGSEASNSFDTLMLQMLGSFAEFERNLSKERQMEGIAIAKAKGLYKGRKPSLNEDEISHLRTRASNPACNMSALARELKISRSTLYGYLKSQ